MKELWTEKYRPSTIEDYVFRDVAQQRQIQNWVAEGALPHLLFSGAPGTGKTTLAKVLLAELGVMDLDILEINASFDLFQFFLDLSMTEIVKDYRELSQHQCC